MQKCTNTLRILLVAGLSLFAFSATVQASNEHITAKLGYVNFKNLPNGNGEINPIRLQALRETATQLGATGALAWQSLQINRTLEEQADYLNHVFDFNQLLLNHNVLPPVLVESDGSLNQDSDDALRLASKTYMIESQAKFVTTPPNWRNYLWMNYGRPDMPSRSLLPTTKDEAAAWNTFLDEGWQHGITQANEIFKVNISRLKRDYKGMVLYRKLLAQRMVSAPFVAQTNLGVTGDSKHIRINDQVLRITAHSELQTDSNKWNPVLAK